MTMDDSVCCATGRPFPSMFDAAASLLLRLPRPIVRSRPVGRDTSATIALEPVLQGPYAFFPSRGPRGPFGSRRAPSGWGVGPGSGGASILGGFPTQVVMQDAPVGERLDPDLQRTDQCPGHGPSLTRQPPVHEDHKMQIRPPSLPRRWIGDDTGHHLGQRDDERLVDQVHGSHYTIMPHHIGARSARLRPIHCRNCQNWVTIAANPRSQFPAMHMMDHTRS